MLVLTRHRGQELTITTPDGTVVRIAITQVAGSQVHVGIDAPRDWKIRRVRD